jgi:putative aldouronate transport system substrate-binding protein
VTYTKDASGKRTLDAGITMLGFNSGAPKQLQKDFGVYNGAFVYGGSKDLMHSFYSDEEAAFYTAQLDGRAVLPLAPPAPLNQEEADEANLIQTPLNVLVTTEELKFILGQRPFSEWDQFVSAVNGAQAPRLAEIVNGAQARFASAHPNG